MGIDLPDWATASQRSGAWVGTAQTVVAPVALAAIASIVPVDINGNVLTEAAGQLMDIYAQVGYGATADVVQNTEIVLGVGGSLVVLRTLLQPGGANTVSPVYYLPRVQVRTRGGSSAVTIRARGAGAAGSVYWAALDVVQVA